MSSVDANKLIKQLRETGQANLKVAGVGPRYTWDVRANRIFRDRDIVRLIVERTITTIDAPDDETRACAFDHVLQVLRDNSATLTLSKRPSIVCTEASYLPSTLMSLVRHTRGQLIWRCVPLRVGGILAHTRKGLITHTLTFEDGPSHEFEVLVHEIEDHIAQLRNLLPVTKHPVIYKRRDAEHHDRITIDQLTHVYESGMRWRDVHLVTNPAGNVEIYRQGQYIRTVDGSNDLGSEVFLWHGFIAPHQRNPAGLMHSPFSGHLQP